MPTLLSQLAGLLDTNSSLPDSKWYMDQNVGSYHFDRQAVKDLNFSENNPGLGIERDNGDHRQMAGFYKNSERNPSVYGLYGYTPFHLGDNFKAGIIGGGVTGYKMPIAPVAGLIGTYQGKNLGVNVTVVPDAKVGENRAYGFTGVQLRYPFK